MRAADVYQALLLCYPGPFRHEYGEQMADAFVDQLRAAAPAGAPKPPCGPARWSISSPPPFGSIVT